MSRDIRLGAILDKARHVVASKLVCSYHAALQMDNRDKDYRYMACSDLAAALVKVQLWPVQYVDWLMMSHWQDSFSCSAEEEHKICGNLIHLLNDTATEVQGVAAKW